VPADSLILYLATTLPPAEAIAVMPDFGIGLVARDGSGLAYVTGRKIEAISTHGAAAPAEKLRRAIDKWDALGRPGIDELVIDVTYDGGRPSMRWRWV
jgi:hypothetical protein